MKKYFLLMRVSSWTKNFFVFVALIFSKTLTDVNNLSETILAFLVFSLSSSIIYVFNDICDVESDRNHPQKRNRPIASGEVSVKAASLVIVLLSVVVIILLDLFTLKFTAIVLTFILINFLYSIKLKEIVLLDIFLIAGGFILRVVGGAAAINVYISDWMILTTLFLSLFLAVMKRRSELNITNDHPETRKVLKYYSNSFIDQISSITAGGVIICYALYSVSEKTQSYFNSDLMVYTTLFVIFGILRYMYLVHHKNKGEDPTKEIFLDIPMIVNIVLYTLSILFIAYIRN